MPVAVVESPTVGPPLRRKKFTRSEVEAMIEAGFFAGQRFELIDGDLIDKAGQKPSHASAIQLCMEVLVLFFGSVRVRIQLPLEAGPTDAERNEPEPDLALLAEAKDEYRKRHPKGQEVALVIEVADSSAGSDLTTKRDLYARAGVPEYWVLDLNERRLVVHRDLEAARGGYGSIQSYFEHESVEIGGRAVVVSAMLP